MADVTRYVSFQIPIPLAAEVDKIVKIEKLGYRSRNEFCVDAIRRRVEHYKNNGGEDETLEKQ